MKGNRTATRYLAMDDNRDLGTVSSDAVRRRRPDKEEADDFDHRRSSRTRYDRTPTLPPQEKSR